MSSPHERGIVAPGIRLWKPRQICLIFLVFLATGFVLHHAGFNSPMVYDSKAFIENNVGRFSSGNPIAVIAIVPERPVFMVSLYLNYLATGMDPYYFRLVNLLILVATSVVLVFLIGLILETPGLKGLGTSQERQLVSAFLGLLFLVHPLQTLVVLYIWQREAIMACFFYYATLAAYLGVRTGRIPWKTPGYVLTCMLFLLGILTKENLVTAPAIMLLAEVALFEQTLRQAAGRLRLIGLIAVPPLVAYLALSRVFHATASLHPEGVLNRLFGYYETGGLAPGEVALTACRVLFSYVCTIVAPCVQGVQLLKAETISRGLWDPPVTLLAVSGVIALLGGGIGLLRRQPLPAFGMVFFIVSLAPELLLIPLFMFFGYRAILPMPGVLLVVGAGVLYLLARFRKTVPPGSLDWVTGGIFLVPVTCLALMTASQASRWNPMNFWTDAFAGLPRYSQNIEPIPYVQVLINFGGQLVNSGDYARAVKILSRAVSVCGYAESGTPHASGEMPVVSGPMPAALRTFPGVTTALFYLGLAHVKNGNPVEGRRWLEIAVKRDPAHESARSVLATLLMESGDRRAAVAQLLAAVKARPTSVAARINLGLAYKKSGNLSAAIDQFRKAVELDSLSAIAHLNLAQTWEDSGDLPLALESYRRAARFMPAAPEIYYGLGNALLKTGDGTEAIKSFQKAVQLKPDYAQAHANLGAALLGAGRASEAVACFGKALPVIKDNAELHNAMGVALAELGQTSEARQHFKKALVLQPNHAAAKENLERIATGHAAPSEGHGEK